ncbi:hypothetical protein LCGC14_2902830, partial [marine sediment metagenome]
TGITLPSEHFDAASTVGPKDPFLKANLEKVLKLFDATDQQVFICKFILGMRMREISEYLQENGYPHIKTRQAVFQRLQKINARLEKYKNSLED